MPPREPALPEGTDKVIAGASGSSGSSGRSASGRAETSAAAGASSDASPGGFVASGTGNDTGSAAERIVGQVRDQVSNLRDQASGKAREFAEGGKDRTTELLANLSEIIRDAARSIDDRLGDQYGEYAHKAGDAVAGLASNLKDKSVEDLIDGTRSLVRKSPAVTVGTAALLGFVLVRLVKSGLEGGGEGSGGRSGGKSGSRGA